MLDTHDRVIERAELVKEGLSLPRLYRRVKTGSMQRKHRRVYTAGGAALTPRGEWRAAVKAIGDATFLDAGSACALWGAREADEGEPVTVVCRREVRHRAGVRVRWQPDLAGSDTTLRHGIPTVTGARALLGYAATRPEPRDLRRVVNQMLVERRTSIPQLVELLARSRGRRGAGRLARVLAKAAPTRSELEDVAMAVLHSFAAPEFRMNAKVAGVEVDVYFPAAGVVLELDSRFHDNPIARADDAAKSARLQAAGYLVQRLRWRDFTTHLHRSIPPILGLLDARAERNLR